MTLAALAATRLAYLGAIGFCAGLLASAAAAPLFEAAHILHAIVLRVP